VQPLVSLGHAVRHPPLVTQIEGRSLRLLRQEFHTLRRCLPALWPNRYFATVGGATSEGIERHVENQSNA
jgi:putative transposase